MSSSNALRISSVAVLAIALAACSSTPRQAAPIVDRTKGLPAAALTAASAPGSVPSYTVKRGDTLYSIALEHGRDWKDLAAWNGIGGAGNLSVGQVLRLGPPEVGAAVATADSPAVQTHAITGSARIESRSLDSAPLPPSGAAPVPTPTVTPPAPVVVPPAVVTPPAAAPSPPPAAPPAARAPSDGITWAWPGSGQVLDKFDTNRNKGLDLAGKTGDPVLAAAVGSVVYSGTGLRGYGKLIIVKHNGNFLSAYAHNSKLLVKEGDNVMLGQKIAEVGSSDADRPKLHFEIRKDGQPVDPSLYLPQR
ncbi:murein hydrolase activator NlpD [soil metagenome]